MPIPLPVPPDTGDSVSGLSFAYDPWASLTHHQCKPSLCCTPRNTVSRARVARLSTLRFMFPMNGSSRCRCSSIDLFPLRLMISVCLLRKKFSLARGREDSFLFSPRNVSFFTFRSSIHLELIFAYGVRCHKRDLKKKNVAVPFP